MRGISLLLPLLRLSSPLRFNNKLCTRMSSSYSSSPVVKIAAVQMRSGSVKSVNLETCRRLVAEAKTKGAQLVCLPECCLFISGGLYTPDSDTPESGPAESVLGQSMQAYRDMARANQVWLSVGSFPEVDGDKRYNLQAMISPSGEVVKTYRKIHLFDSPYSGLFESHSADAGNELCVVDTGFAKVGMSTCYDLRFPGLYSALRELGAEIILVPSAFTYKTGLAHWDVLLRARAIETQSFIVAAAQAGRHNEKRESFGHTLMIDAWGRVGNTNFIINGGTVLNDSPYYSRRMS
jgi:predicted amidohydrolase